MAGQVGPKVSPPTTPSLFPCGHPVTLRAPVAMATITHGPCQMRAWFKEQDLKWLLWGAVSGCLFKLEQGMVTVGGRGSA